MVPPEPSHEAQRLCELHSLKLLDTQPEERFDRITRIAQQIFKVPIALLSLVDSTRQWFKSKQGITASETGREISFCGHAILSSDCLVVPDARLDLRFADNPLVTGSPNIRFYAGYPLSGPGGQKVGTLCIIDFQPRQMSAAELQILRDLGQLVEIELGALALQHVMHELNEHRRKLRERDELFREISENVSEVFWVVDLESQRLIYVNSAYETIWKRRGSDLYENPLAWIEGIHPEDREIVHVQYADAIITREGFESEYRVITPSGISRNVHDRRFTVLGEDGQPYRLIGIVTDITERKRAERKLERLAMTDGLTGFYTSRFFQERVSQELALARRRGSALSLAMLDLDNFKAINDNFGHNTGDDVLMSVAKSIRSRVRASDCAARVGGDEFAILLHDTTATQARMILEEMRQSIDSLILSDARGSEVRIRCSIGLAAFDDRCTDTKTFKRLADEALYKAKASGRNQVASYESAGESARDHESSEPSGHMLAAVATPTQGNQQIH